MPDHYVDPLTQTANYFNNLLITDPLELMRKYSVCPPLGVTGHTVKEVGQIMMGGNLNQAFNPVTQPRMRATTRTDNIRLARVDRAHRIAYLNLKKVDRAGIEVTGKEGADRISFETSVAHQAGWVPVYYLPWGDGKAIRLTIPTHDPLNPGPDRFFTAALSGCSIFFQGTPQNPTIYHCGGDSGQGVNAQHGAEFWQEVMQRFIAADTARGKNKGALFAQDVNKTQYVKTPGVGTGTLAPGEGTSTHAAMAFQHWLEADNRDNLVLEEVNPWACVMGIRDGADWAFYLQQNATVIYHQFYKKNLFSKKRPKQRTVARPLILSQVFPQGPCQHLVWYQIPRIR
jgi:hypothetical protein